MTDLEDQPSVVDLVIPVLDRCRKLAELLSQLLLSN
jgi:ribosomal protein S2